MAEPLLSFIVPVLNESQHIAANLAELRRCFGAAEIVVVDGGSTDGTLDSARAYCDQLLQTEPGRARQMNAGAASARGRYFAFLHSDTRLTCSADEFAAVLATEPQWGFFRVSAGRS